MATTSGWYPQAQHKPCPGYWVGHYSNPKAVVLHIVQGGAQGCIEEFAGGSVSAHFLIAKDGTVYQFVSIYDSAWGNGLSWQNGGWIDPEGNRCQPTWKGLIAGVNPNLYTISIEHEGFTGAPWPDAMISANDKLCAWIAQQTGIFYRPLDTLIGHCHISPVDRPQCPGTSVNYQQRADAANLLANPPRPQPTVPAGSPNGIAIDDRLYAYWQQSGGIWRPDRVALGYPLTPCISNVQIFERGGLRARSDGGIDALLLRECLPLLPK